MFLTKELSKIPDVFCTISLSNSRESFSSLVCLKELLEVGLKLLIFGKILDDIERR